MLDAVIIAGSPNSGPLREVSGEEYEALIRIGNKTMIEYVIDALFESGVVRKVVVSGPKEIEKFITGRNVVMAPLEGTVIGNAVSAMAFVDRSSPVLISTCDIPLLSGEAVKDFVRLCSETDADFYYPIVSMTDADSSFPGVKRTSVKLREGTFTGGNLFLVNPAIIPRSAAKAQEFVNYRKSPFRLSRLLGIKFVAKLLLNRLSVSEVEIKLSQLMDFRAKAVITKFPGIGIDVDKPSDFQLIEEFLDH